MSRASLCVDAYDNPTDEYVGHDEPSIEFKSSVAGSGNDVTYTVTLPSDPQARPSASGAGATWNFELRPTFWFGLTLCDSESSPEFTKTCTPDSDANDLVGTNPAAADYIGKHPGNAYMELQFYGPGYVPQFEGFGCAATQYCAAMTIDSRTPTRTPGSENTDRLQQLHPRRSRADQLGVHHEERRLPGARQSARHRDVLRSELRRGESRLHQGSDDEPRRPHPHPHARHNGRLPHRLNDLTSGESGSMTASVGERVRAHPVHAGLVDVPGGAVRVPPRIQHGQPAGQHMVGAHLQRRLLRRDRALRELPARSTRTSTAPHPARTTRVAWTPTTTTTSVSRDPTRCS